MLSPSAKEVLWRLFIGGAVWDGDAVSNEGRGELIDFQLAVRHDGWTILTMEGLKRALSLGMARRKESLKNA